jgi:mono/diheme cytochrome c family protein
MFRSAFFMNLVSCCLVNQATAAEPDRVDFARQVLPLFADRCFACHGPDEKTREADLRLDLRASVFDRDAESLLIRPGKSSDSPLFERISSHDPDVRMPPPSATRQLKPNEIDLIRKWIDQGRTGRSTGHSSRPSDQSCRKFRMSIGRETELIISFLRDSTAIH